MGNKHSEPPQAASGSNEGRLAVTSSNKDDVDEPVIDGMCKMAGNFEITFKTIFYTEIWSFFK